MTAKNVNPLPDYPRPPAPPAPPRVKHNICPMCERPEMTRPTQSAEQRARDLLDRMGVPDAQNYSAGELVELANLIANQR